MAVKIGSYTVPPKLETVAQWAKFIVAVAALVAGVAIHLFTGLPAWVLLIPAVAGVLGVGVVPNGSIVSEIKDVDTLLRDASAAVEAGKTGNVAVAVEDAKGAEAAAVSVVDGAKDAVKVIEPTAQTEPVVAPEPVVPAVPKNPAVPDGGHPLT